MKSAARDPTLRPARQTVALRNSAPRRWQCRGVAPYVLVDRQSVLPGGADAAEGARNLVIAERGDPVDLVVRVPKAVRSVFRGSVRPKQVASADIIQVWLDVSEHPSRGAEQAELIWRRHLAALVGESSDA